MSVTRHWNQSGWTYGRQHLEFFCFKSNLENPWLAKSAHSLEDSSTLPPCGIPTHCPPLPIQKSILCPGNQLIKEKTDPFLDWASLL